MSGYLLGPWDVASKRVWAGLTKGNFEMYIRGKGALRKIRKEDAHVS